MRGNAFRTGIVCGLVAPIIGFLLYGCMYVTAIRPDKTLGWFVWDLFFGTRTYQSPVLSLSLIASVPLFFWFDHKGWSHAMRGVLLSMLIYGVIIVVLWF